MAQLRSALARFTEDWQQDLPPAWRFVVDGAAPAINQVPTSLTIEPDEAIFPARRGVSLSGARADAHLFRAFDEITPTDVKAVVLGQDPYPKRSRATGRAFEQGDIDDWAPQPATVAQSLRRIIQVLAHEETGNQGYIANDSAWSEVVADIESGQLRISRPKELFDRWQRRGVLFLNAALTLSRFNPETQQAHFAFWKPVIRAILTHLAMRQDRTVVFLLWGQVARNTFDELGVLEAATAAGTRKQIAVAEHRHPSAEAAGRPLFFSPPNPLSDANEQLSRVGGTAINW